MKSNGMPAALSLPLVAGVAKGYEFEVKGYEGGDIKVDFYSFWLVVRSASGYEQEIGATASGNVIFTQFPALSVGEYDWALVGADTSGDREVLVSGKLGVFWPDLNPGGEAVSSPNNRVVVRLGGELAVMKWQRTGYVDFARSEVQKGVQYVAEQVQVVQGFVALFDGKFSTAVYVDPVSGNLVIGGKDSGVKVDGVAPHIDANGHWRYWDASTKSWVDGGAALGRDGRDGATVRRILVGSFDEIPQEGDTCNGGVYYYVPNGEFYDIYAWFDADGWVRVDMKYDLADTETYGLMKYGTDAVVEHGAPVGRNASGQASVPVASSSVAGVGKVAGVSVPQCPVYVDADENFTVPIVSLNNSVGAMAFTTVPMTSEGPLLTVASEVFYIGEFGPGIAVADEDHFGVVMRATEATGDGYVSGSLLSKELSGFLSKADAYSKDEVYTKEEADARYMEQAGGVVTSTEVTKLSVVALADFLTMERDSTAIYFVTT